MYSQSNKTAVLIEGKVLEFMEDFEAGLANRKLLWLRCKLNAHGGFRVGHSWMGIFRSDLSLVSKLRACVVCLQVQGGKTEINLVAYDENAISGLSILGRPSGGCKLLFHLESRS